MAVSEMAGAYIRAMLVTTTLLSINSGNSNFSMPASVACIHRKFLAFASISALTAPKTTSASGSSPVQFVGVGRQRNPNVLALGLDLLNLRRRVSGRRDYG